MTEEEDFLIEHRICFWILMAFIGIMILFPFFWILGNIRDAEGWHFEVLLQLVCLVTLWFLMYLFNAELMSWIEFDDEKICVKKFGFRNIIKKYEIAYKDIESVKMSYKWRNTVYNPKVMTIHLPRKVQVWTIRTLKNKKNKTYRHLPIEDLEERQRDLLVKMNCANKNIHWDIPMPVPNKSRKYSNKRKKK